MKRGLVPHKKGINKSLADILWRLKKLYNGGITGYFSSGVNNVGTNYKRQHNYRTDMIFKKFIDFTQNTKVRQFAFKQRLLLITFYSTPPLSPAGKGSPNSDD